ncbi:hypothetical protein EYF80_066005 [Liparis tanakae]|uniref:Uncharacterized protein n=1 Tax=Liparis tanakae TaxID=230148 RepID=A0A4Z2E5E6_9TELE|nr:hypothetical protein EYF80_066005 [Liparis tanakae]
MQTSACSTRRSTNVRWPPRSPSQSPPPPPPPDVVMRRRTSSSCSLTSWRPAPRSAGSSLSRRFWPTTERSAAWLWTGS